MNMPTRIPKRVTILHSAVSYLCQAYIHHTRQGQLVCALRRVTVLPTAANHTNRLKNVTATFILPPCRPAEEHAKSMLHKRLFHPTLFSRSTLLSSRPEQRCGRAIPDRIRRMLSCGRRTRSPLSSHPRRACIKMQRR